MSEDNRAILIRIFAAIVIILLFFTILLISFNHYYIEDPVDLLQTSIMLLLIIPFVAPFGLVLLIPAAIPIWFVNKLTKNSSEKKKFLINLFSISFFIPFINCILYLFTIIFKFNFANLIIELIGFDWLVVILPICFIITILFPRKYFEHKKFTVLTIFITFVIGSVLMLISLKSGELITTNQQLKELDEYRPTINYIKNYKKEHNIYPETLKNDLLKSKSHPYYEYKIYNNKKDFKLRVSKYKYPQIEDYIYCSNKISNGCEENPKFTTLKHEQIGEWIKEENIDD